MTFAMEALCEYFEHRGLYEVSVVRELVFRSFTDSAQPKVQHNPIDRKPCRAKSGNYFEAPR